MLEFCQTANGSFSKSFAAGEFLKTKNVKIKNDFLEKQILKNEIEQKNASNAFFQNFIFVTSLKKKNILFQPRIRLPLCSNSRRQNGRIAGEMFRKHQNASKNKLKK